MFFLLGFLSILYGMVVRAVGSGTAFFIIWFLIAAFFFCLSLFLQKGWYRFLPLWVRWGMSIFFLLGFSFFVFVESLIAGGFHEESAHDPDYLIVLGAQVYESGPSVVLRYRLDRAADFLMEHEDCICIVTGAQGYNEPFTEALGMRDYLLKKGIPEERIMLEEQATTTMENIRFSMDLMEGDGEVGIVTNNFHIYRALLTAKKAGLSHAFGIPAGSVPFYLPHNMLREFFGLIKFFLIS